MANEKVAAPTSLSGSIESSALSDAMSELDTSDDSSPTESGPENTKDTFDSDDGDAAPEADPADDTTTESEVADEGEEKLGADEEFITVTDSSGTRKIKINYGDRAATKRAHEKAAGAEKLYGTYVKLKEETAALKKFRDENAEKIKNYQTFSELYGQGEPERADQLLTRLYGDKAVDVARAILDKHDEYEALPSEEKLTRRYNAETAALKKELDSVKTRQQEIDFAAAKSAAESALASVWPTYTFTGKLGDAAQEKKLDSFMMDMLKSRLRDAESSGYSITGELIKANLAEIQEFIPEAIRSGVRKTLKEGRDTTVRAAAKAAQSATISSTSRANKGDGAGKVDWSSPTAVANYLEKAARDGK
jgi:hypothetical protein